MGDLLHLVTADKFRIDNSKVLIKDDIRNTDQILLQAKHLGRFQSGVCCICEQNTPGHLIVRPLPCKHTAHLSCMARLSDTVREYRCPHCSSIIDTSIP